MSEEEQVALQKKGVMVMCELWGQTAKFQLSSAAFRPCNLGKLT